MEYACMFNVHFPERPLHKIKNGKALHNLIPASTSCTTTQLLAIFSCHKNCSFAKQPKSKPPSILIVTRLECETHIEFF